MRPFDVEDHGGFFGRSHDVDQLTGLLRAPAGYSEAAVLLVVGPSGCGKSSLVRAGLLHVMSEEAGWWKLDPLVPGIDPEATLVRERAGSRRRAGYPDSPVATLPAQR